MRLKSNINLWENNEAIFCWFFKELFRTLREHGLLVLCCDNLSLATLRDFCYGSMTKKPGCHLSTGNNLNIKFISRMLKLPNTLRNVLSILFGPKISMVWNRLFRWAKIKKTRIWKYGKTVLFFQNIYRQFSKRRCFEISSVGYRLYRIVYAHKIIESAIKNRS